MNEEKHTFEIKELSRINQNGNVHIPHYLQEESFVDYFSSEYIAYSIQSGRKIEDIKGYEQFATDISTFLNTLLKRHIENGYNIEDESKTIINSTIKFINEFPESYRRNLQIEENKLGKNIFLENYLPWVGTIDMFRNYAANCEHKGIFTNKDSEEPVINILADIFSINGKPIADELGIKKSSDSLLTFNGKNVDIGNHFMSLIRLGYIGDKSNNDIKANIIARVFKNKHGYRDNPSKTIKQGMSIEFQQESFTKVPKLSQIKRTLPFKHLSA